MQCRVWRVFGMFSTHRYESYRTNEQRVSPEKSMTWFKRRQQFSVSLVSVGVRQQFHPCRVMTPATLFVIVVNIFSREPRDVAEGTAITSPLHRS